MLMDIFRANEGLGGGGKTYRDKGEIQAHEYEIALPGKIVD
jgi:hypothetical protein